MTRLDLNEMQQQFTQPSELPPLEAYGGTSSSSSDDPRIYRVKMDDIKNSPNKMFSACIRFLCNPFNIEDADCREPLFRHNVVTSLEYERLTDVHTIASMKFPRTRAIKFPPAVKGIRNEINAAYWAMHKSIQGEKEYRDAKMKELGMQSFPQERYYTLIQVMEDKMHPELVGRVFIFKFGRSLLDIMYKSMGHTLPTRKSANSEPTQQVPQGKYDVDMLPNPFDPVNGHLFILKAKLNDINMPDYKDSSFIHSEKGKYPVTFVPQSTGKQHTMTDYSSESLGLYAEWLESVAPAMLNDFAFKGFTPEDEKFIAEYIRYYTDPTYREQVNMASGGGAPTFTPQAPQPQFTQQQYVAPQAQPQFTQTQVQAPQPQTPQFTQPQAPAPQPMAQPQVQQPAPPQPMGGMPDVDINDLPF
jgi:hypothetical protein|nr:MAG TPA: single-stranded DNA binding protein [Caudoviricetes sp.]